MSLFDTATDIVVSVHNRYQSTRGLIEGIYRHTDSPFHLYVIDNASTDETADIDKIYTRDITIIHNRRNTVWCAGVNQGTAMGNNPNIVIINSGTEISKGWLGSMLAFMDTHPRIGAVGPLGSCPGEWQYIDNVREKVAPQIPIFRTGDIHERNIILQYHFHNAGILIERPLSFFCVALKRRTVSQIGMLNEKLAFSDASNDYCQRLRKAGYVLGIALGVYAARNPGEQFKPLPFDDAVSDEYTFV